MERYDGNWMREMIHRPIINKLSGKYTLESRLTESEHDEYFDYIVKTGHIDELAKLFDYDIIFELLCKDYEDSLTKI